MNAPLRDTRQTWWPALIVVLAAIGVGLYYWQVFERRERLPEAVTQAPSEAEAPAEPEIRHPIEKAQPAEPLPPLAESDAPLQDAANALIGKETFEKYFHPKEIVRRFVVTVDSLPRKKLPRRYGFTRPVAGRFAASGAADDATISPDNFRRYAPYVRLAESVDTGRLVALYVHFYPLLQEEYQNLGYPNRYFNDRLVEAIDDLLAAPEPKGPIKLVQPKVMYELADPRLEGLSAGQKIMIRMGPENAKRVKTKLEAIREALASRGR